MRNLVLLFVCTILSTSVTLAQSIKGKVNNTAGEPIPFANVTLHQKTDSTLISGTTTNSDGNFEMKVGNPQNSFIQVSYIGYETQNIEISDSHLQITLNPITLDEVVVIAPDAVVKSGKITYYPTNRQSNSASNLVELLNNMSIPQLRTSGENNVTTLSGEAVALFIDYNPATQEEINALNPRDVRKVDFFISPTDPRFRGERYVVNYIMQKYEYGGYTRIHTNDYVIDQFRSRSGIYSKLAYKKMSYDLNLYNSYSKFSHIGVQTDETFRLPQDGESFTTIHRKQVPENTSYEGNSPSLSFRALYSTDKMQLSTKFSLAHSSTPDNTMQGTLSYTPEMFSTSKFSQKEQSSTTSPTLQLNYYFMLPRGWFVVVAPWLEYKHSKIDRHYSAGSDIVNKMTEDSWQLDGYSGIGKRWTKHSVNLNFNTTALFSKVSYRINTHSDQDLRIGYFGPSLHYTYRNDKLLLSPTLAVFHNSSVVNGEKGNNEWVSMFLFNMRYAFNQKHSLDFSIRTNVMPTDAADVNPTIVQQNEMMYYSGNANAKAYSGLYASTNYTWLQSNKFSISATMSYNNRLNRRVEVYRPYDDGKALLRTIQNDGNFHELLAYTSFSLKLLDNKLQLSATPSIKFYKITGEYATDKMVGGLDLNASYYLGNFYLRGSYRKGWEGYESLSQYFEAFPDSYSLKAGWGNANWNVSIAALNFFNRGYTAYIQQVTSPYYSSTLTNYGITYHRSLNFTVSYTFGYGKKINKGNEIGDVTTSSSAIR